MCFLHLIWVINLKVKLAFGKFILRFYFFPLFIFFSCISEFDPKVENETPKLTVDGLITDQPGPHKVTLRYSTPYVNDETVFFRFEDGADVTILDELGNEVNLVYTKAGEYLTDPNFVGKVGSSYTLKIELPDGRLYQSFPEELRSVPPIDTVYTSYEEFSGSFLRGEFSVFMNFVDPASTKDFYQWNWTHYNSEKYCRIFTSQEYGVYIATQCCDSCWSIVECNSCINLLSDNFYNGSKVTGVPILKVPYDSKEPYFVQIRLKSITESAYNFWKSVSEQIGNSGGIFDKPPLTIKGNIFNAVNPDEQILGYFGASAISEKPIYIARDHISKIPFGVINPRYTELSGCIQCEVGPLRTDQTPKGW